MTGRTKRFWHILRVLVLYSFVVMAAIVAAFFIGLYTTDQWTRSFRISLDNRTKIYPHAVPAGIQDASLPGMPNHQIFTLKKQAFGPGDVEVATGLIVEEQDCSNLTSAVERGHFHNKHLDIKPIEDHAQRRLIYVFPPLIDGVMTTLIGTSRFGRLCNDKLWFTAAQITVPSLQNSAFDEAVFLVPHDDREHELRYKILPP